MSDRQMTAYTADQLFAEWLSHGLVQQADLAQLEAFTLRKNEETGLPFYLHILSGIGAAVTAAFLIGFLLVARVIDMGSTSGPIVWGLLLIAAGCMLALGQQRKAGTMGISFIQQISFCLMATGKILFVFGCAKACAPQVAWGATLGALLVAAATYGLYAVSIDRFLSVLAVLVLVFISLLTEFPFEGGATALLSALFIAQLAAAALLLTGGRVRRGLMPIAYALIASLSLEALAFASQSTSGLGLLRLGFNPAAINIALAVALIALIAWAAGGLKKLDSQPLLLASLGTAALAIVSTPGILLSIGLMIFGYARHERLLLLLGGLLFPVFLSLYYYNLHLTLMEKSGLLVASGAVLLAGWAYTHYRSFDSEV